MIASLRCIAFCVVVGVAFSACGSKKPQGPSGVGAFLTDYQAAYEDKNREQIMLMVDWHGVDEELRDYTKQTAFPYAGRRAIRSIEHEDYEVALSDTREHEGKAIVPGPPPTHRVVIVFEPENRNAQPERYELLLVEHEGAVKICGWAYEE